MACRFCPQSTLARAYESRGEGTILTVEAFKAILAKVPRHVRIEFSGMAEPFLCPDCTEMILLAHQRGHEISVFTTGTGLSPADVERIKGLPFKRFVVHLPDMEGHARIDVSDGYLDTLRAIDRTPIRGREFMTMGTLPKAVRKVVGKVKPTRMMSRAGNVPGIECPERLTGAIRCRSGDALNHNVLLPNGDVVLCCMDYGLRHILGNLTRDDYAAIFKGGEIAQIKAALNDDSADILCRYCENASPVDTG